ncbi:sensor histidine kinase [Fodinicola feengrottensis]|uniref:Sensor histidine kinase n=1 Tax=Fodinicola feengrottensis TaxID=435914 RepID=A0ABN2JCQ4_9ACTN
MTATTVDKDPGDRDQRPAGPSGCEPASIPVVTGRDRPGWWPVRAKPGGGLGNGRFGWVYGAIWQAYLAIPMFFLWFRPNGPWKWIGIVALTLFAVVYTATFALNRRWRNRKPFIKGERWLSLLVLAGLAALVVPGGEVAGLYTYLYVAVAGVAMLSTIEAVIVAVICIGSASLVGYLNHWDGWEFLALTSLSATFGMWGVGKIIQQSIALRQANEQIRDLAIADERARVARDLHDVLGHSLTVISVKAELASRLAEIDPRRAGAEIADVHQLARDALAEVRTTVAGFREGSLAGELAGARAALTAAGIEPDLPSSADQVTGARRQLFGWALREGVTNVVRHSGARLCRVTLTSKSIEIADDGAGPVTTDGSLAGGHGLVGLGERVAAADAELTIGRSPEGGFLLRVTTS